MQWTEAVPNSILVGSIAATIGTVVGAVVGLISGYFGGKVDAVLRVLIDVFLSVPSLLFLILIASLVRGVGVLDDGPHHRHLRLGLARPRRARPGPEPERAPLRPGRPSLRHVNLEIVGRELLPHMLTWLGANFLNAFIAAILAESGLSILGLGPQREMTLGMMIYWSLSTTARSSRTSGGGG